MAQAEAPPVVGVAGVGGFGAAVRDRFSREFGAAAMEIGERGADWALLSQTPGVVVLALWRPMEGLCESFDAAAFAAGRPWLSVVFDQPWLLVGPWVAPPDGPCYRCYQARRTQHREPTDTGQALAEAYAADQSFGVEGHLPHHLRLAVGLTRQLLRLREPGLVLSVNTVDSRISAHRTVGCHGCPRCGRRDRLGADGAVAEAVRSLRSMALAGIGGAR